MCNTRERSSLGAQELLLGYLVSGACPTRPIDLLSLVQTGSYLRGYLGEMSTSSSSTAPLADTSRVTKPTAGQ